MDRKFNFHGGITFILAFSFYTVASSPVEKSILDAIQFCPTLEFLQKSSYTVECSKIPYPKEFINKPDLAMCMTVNDITNKLCLYLSQVPVTSKENKVQLSVTPEEFDNKLKNEFDINLKEPTKNKYDSYIANFCKNISLTANRLNSLGIKSNNDTVHFIEYVNTTLLAESECGYTCHRPHYKINPICVVLAWANDLFRSLKSLKPLNNSTENVPIKTESISAHSVQVTKEPPSVLDNKQIVQTQPNTEKSHNTNKAPATASKSSPQKQSSNEPKKSDEKTAKTVDTSSKKVAYEVKKDSEKSKMENQGKNDPNLPLPSINENANVAVSKPSQIHVQNPNDVPPEDANAENDFTSGEDHPNKKDNANDIEDGNEQENIDNEKDSIINLDDGGAPPGSSDQQDLLPESKKFDHHSSITKVEDESHFFTYFSFIVIICIGLYVGYHNKQKILAMVLEGRRSRRGRGSRRRPSTASYRKLDCNLEEAVTSQCNANVTHVIY